MDKEQLLNRIADLGVDINSLLASGFVAKDQTSSEFTEQVMHDQNLSNAYTLIRSKLSEIYLILKATEIEFKHVEN